MEDRARSARLKLAVLAVAIVLAGCAKATMGKLTFVDPVSPVVPENVSEPFWPGVVIVTAFVAPPGVIVPAATSVNV